MNYSKEIFFSLLFCIISVSIISQTDTAKQENLEVPIYKAACKLLDSANYKDAISMYKNAIKINPTYYQAFNKMAFAKYKLKDYKGAEKDLIKSKKNPQNNFDIYKTLALIYLDTKKYEEAKVSLDSAILLNPDDSEVLYSQAKLMFLGKSYKLALSTCEAALDINPRYMEVYFLKGEIKYLQKEYNYAIKEITDGLKFENAAQPNYDAYKIRAKARYEVHDYKNAINDWNLYLEAFPNDEQSLILRGINKIELNDNTDAIVDFDAAIKINPKNPMSYNYRGVAKGENKQFVEALKDFDTAIKLKFDYGSAFVNRAAVKHASKDKRGACEDLHKADALGDEMAPQLIETYCKLK
ncbi:MAG: tetratricopeptide repeat protein [Bacteroidota bacterium]